MEAIRSGKYMEGKSFVIQTCDSSCVESDGEYVDESEANASSTNKVKEVATNHRRACATESLRSSTLSVAKFNVHRGGSTPLTLGGWKKSCK